MITNVKLKNWRSHASSELNFNKGTNALVGHIGSGKTTILDSICFAFFGTFPNLQARKLKLEDLIMNKPSIKDMAEVEVSFQVDDKTYSVKRIIEKRKGTTYSEIRENNKLVEAPSPQRVTEIVEKILKVDYELFSKAIYSEQNALDYFLTIPKGQRMRKIDELLMIDKFERARANATTLVNRVVERKSAKQSMVDQSDMGELETIVNDLKSQLDNILSEKVQLENENSETTRKRAFLEKELKELYKLLENFEALKRDEKGITSAMQEISDVVSKLEGTLANIDKDSLRENISASTRLVDELTNLLNEKNNDYQKFLSQYSRSKTEHELYKKELNKLNDQFEEMVELQKEAERLKKRTGKDSDNEIDKKKILVEEYIGKLESIKIRMNDLVDVIDQLSSVKAKCPICESKLTEEKKIVLIKQKQKEIHDLNEDLERFSRQKQIAEEDLRNIERSINKLKELVIVTKNFEEIKSNREEVQNILKVLIENTSSYEKELIKIKKELSDVQGKINTVQDDNQKFEIMLLHMRNYEASKVRIEELNSQRNRILAHLQEADRLIAGRNIQMIENELRHAVGREREVSAKITALDKLVSERESRLKELETSLSVGKREKEEIKKLDHTILQLKIFGKALEETQIQLRQEFIISVNAAMNRLWETLYPYQDFSGIRLNVEEGDYVLQLQSRNEWVNVEGIASGGERSIAALTLRIAFSLVLAPQLRWLFLDEPTQNLDTASVNVLANTLRDRIGEFIDQCFLITHQSELEDAVTGNAYRLERDKANDGYTQIIQLN
ncbi:MAG: SMC family ATPase [Candidatus Aenigmarchaeota archaeon]|nr:SMC family ATPase [Candidatus Aenigmarchaeota archaeon]